MPTSPSNASTKNANDAVYTLKQVAREGHDLGMGGLNIADLKVNTSEDIPAGLAIIRNPRHVVVNGQTRGGDTYSRMVGVGEATVVIGGRERSINAVFTSYQRKPRGRNGRFDKDANEERNVYNNETLGQLLSSGALDADWIVVSTYGGFNGSISTMEDASLRKDVCVLAIANVVLSDTGATFTRPTQDQVFSEESETVEQPKETPAQRRQRQREEAMQAKAAANEPEPASV